MPKITKEWEEEIRQKAILGAEYTAISTAFDAFDDLADLRKLVKGLLGETNASWDTVKREAKAFLDAYEGKQEPPKEKPIVTLEDLDDISKRINELMKKVKGDK